MKENPRIRRALEETGLPWRIDHARRHRLIKLNDQIVGVLPLAKGDGGDPRCVKNIVCQIKRAARQMRGKKPCN